MTAVHSTARPPYFTQNALQALHLSCAHSCSMSCNDFLWLFEEHRQRAPHKLLTLLEVEVEPVLVKTASLLEASVIFLASGSHL